MTVLTQLTLDADGTKDTTNLSHDAGTGDPWVGHCNDDPTSSSSDFIQNNTGLADGNYVAWFSLSDVDSNFGSMDGLNIDVDVEVVGAVTNDTVTLTARIADGDGSGTFLTDETASLGTELDAPRTQRNVLFSGLTGSKAQWNTAHIRFTWAYDRVSGPDSYSLRLYGCDIDGTYTIAALKAAGEYTILGPGAFSRPPYASFAGKGAPAAGRLLLINPPGLDGGFGTGASL